MGGLISAPVSAAASCLGGCGAVVFGQLLGSGSVSSDRGARALLLWLQFFAALLTLLVSIDPKGWLSWPCDKIGDVGICECRSDSDVTSCYISHLAFRVEGAAVVLFTFLLLLACSGCSQGAAGSYVVMRFFMILLLGFAFLFVPNKIFSVFGEVASGMSALFIVAQAVLVIDFAYKWNETWYAYSLAALRQSPGSGQARTWQGIILAAAGVLLSCVLVVSLWLFVAVPSTETNAVLIPSLVVGVALLLVSITDWCEHGALLTSTVVMAYSMWLVVEALTGAPNLDFSPKGLRIVELAACLVTLFALAGGASSARAVLTHASEGVSPARLEAGHHSTEDGEVAAGTNGWAFAMQCAVHAAAALYICSAVALSKSAVTFGLRIAAVVASLALYGWSLVAPKVLTGRSFG
mmetsp:Transcript_48267/g.140737  ORF Transcript_48267/g.140737 Transcript_48267/m.140737 type:complete len:408 (+) Transcript_48267:91-1314(+)